MGKSVILEPERPRFKLQLYHVIRDLTLVSSILPFFFFFLQNEANNVSVQKVLGQIEEGT